MSFTITPEVWNGRHYRIRPEPPIGMITYDQAAKMFGYSKNSIAHLVSDGRVRGGHGLVSTEEMGRWASGRMTTPNESNN